MSQPLGNGTFFGTSFFPSGEGSCLYLETLLDPWDTATGFDRILISSISLETSYGIFYRFVIQCERQGEKCFTWFHGQCVKMSKRC